MKLTARLLTEDASLNLLYSPLSGAWNVRKGDTFKCVFQLWNEDLGIRYVPTSAATMTFSISMFPEYTNDQTNSIRIKTDYSVQQAAAMLDSGDRSLWYSTLTAAQTLNITTSAVLLTLTDGALTKIIRLPRAIQASNAQESL